MDNLVTTDKVYHCNKVCCNRRSAVTCFVFLLCLVGFLVNLQREDILHVIGPVTSKPKVRQSNYAKVEIKSDFMSSSSSLQYHPEEQQMPKIKETQTQVEMLENLPFLEHSGETVTSLDVTSAQTTTVKLVSHKTDTTVYVGDTLHFLIEAKDSWGKPKTVGGDFWLGALRSPHLRAGTTGRIVDHDNGTYSMLFIAGWIGDAMVELTLAHPSEAVYWLKTTFKYADHVPKWDGVFQLNDMYSQVEEHSKCFVLYDSTWNNMCEYQPKKALKHTKFVCQRPPTLSCESLTGIYGESDYVGEFYRLLPTNKRVLFQGEHLYRKVPIFLGYVHIKGRPINQSLVQNDYLPNLPSCGRDLIVPFSDGYWYDAKWHSLACKATQTYDKTSAIKCLIHTNVIFTGDSTTRQWFASLAELLDVGQPEDHERSFFLERIIVQPDINISFIFHPLSTHPKPVFVNFSQVRFEADVLLGIPVKNTCNYVVVISPWAHFIMWPWDAYMEWLTHIRDAMVEVKRTCPKLKVVIKSPHAVDRVTSMKGRDYIFTEMMQAMREVFQGHGVLFLDIWDMDYAYPAPMTLHMPTEVINEEIALFLSYLCPQKT